MARSGHLKSGQMAYWAQSGKLQHQHPNGDANGRLVGATLRTAGTRHWTLSQSRHKKCAQEKLKSFSFHIRAKVYPGSAEQEINVYSGDGYL